MKISDVAAAAGCSVRSVRHLHEAGVVSEPARTSGNYREYSVRDLAAVIRARALIDAGVPVADVQSDDAVARSLTLLDERIRHLQHQRERLALIQHAPLGAPEDIRQRLSAVFEDADTLQLELDSWDLMALTGVATSATWTRLRQNLGDYTCIAAAREAGRLWSELATLTSRDEKVAPIVQRLHELFPLGLMQGVLETLQPAQTGLTVGDVPTRGAQAFALESIAGSLGG
ncbi:MerR family transcriptional regulator [Corynebacterium riegelii]|uniref:MerR family transcriptional regulator n=1 Tax=Corynebacterium riegelii TaxID=156976 RepID=UPI00288A7AD0|nr:MerR family transcriptional regulator [Corynebacterium riegelii]